MIRPEHEPLALLDEAIKHSEETIAWANKIVKEAIEHNEYLFECREALIRALEKEPPQEVE